MDPAIIKLTIADIDEIDGQKEDARKKPRIVFVNQEINQKEIDFKVIGLNQAAIITQGNEIIVYPKIMEKTYFYDTFVNIWLRDYCGIVTDAPRIVKISNHKIFTRITGTDKFTGPVKTARKIFPFSSSYNGDGLQIEVVPTPDIELQNILKSLESIIQDPDDMPGLGGGNCANTRAYQRGMRRLKVALKKAYELGRRHR